jgi:hypothetical protein
LRIADEDVLVVRRGSLQTGEGVLPVPHAQLERWLVNPRNRLALYSLYAADVGRPPVVSGSLDHAEAFDHIKAAVEEAFRRGRLVVVGAPPSWSIIVDPGAKRPNGDTAGPVAGPNAKTKKTWIEIRLVNKKGDPVPGAKYRLKLTDGSVQEGATDDFGSTRVSGIDPGTCEVSFLEFDAKEWKKV